MEKKYVKSTQEFIKILKELVENNKITKEEKEKIEIECAYIQFYSPEKLHEEMNSIINRIL